MPLRKSRIPVMTSPSRNDVLDKISLPILSVELLEMSKTPVDN